MNAAAHYEGAPSFNYTIDYVTVEPDGTVSFDARADSDEIETLIDGLAEAGFEPEGSTTETETGEIEPHAEAEQTDGEQTADEADYSRGVARRRDGADDKHSERSGFHGYGRNEPERFACGKGLPYQKSARSGKADF